MSRRGSSRGGRQTASLSFRKRGPAKRAPRQRTVARLETQRAKAKARAASDTSRNALTWANGGRPSPSTATSSDVARRPAYIRLQKLDHGSFSQENAGIEVTFGGT
jgi:hypothetical protein